MTPAALAKLQHLAARVESRDMGALRAQMAARDAALAGRAQLDALRADMFATPHLAVGPAYAEWLRAEQARLARQLAQIERRIAGLRGAAAQSMARRRVLDGLLEKAQHQGALTARRRDEQNGQPHQR